MIYKSAKRPEYWQNVTGHKGCKHIKQEGYGFLCGTNMLAFFKRAAPHIGNILMTEPDLVASISNKVAAIFPV